MINSYDENLKKLEKYNQKHLLLKYKEMNQSEQLRLLDEINNIDFELMKNLYEDTKKQIDFSAGKIEPIEYKDKSKLNLKEKEEYTKIGEEEVQRGKLAVVTMAGGQGTRLGHDGPKGTFDIGLDSHKSLFELLCDSLKEANNKYNVVIPWYIMTSNENNEQTVEFFKKNNYFKYPKEAIRFFIQGEIPMIDTNGKILLDEQGFIKKAADGHGGIFNALDKNNIIKDMEKRKIEWVFISGIDNPLAKMVDPLFMGFVTKEGSLIGSKTIIKRSPDEKVGVFCKKNNRPYVIEYIEITDEMANLRDSSNELVYGESHILLNMFNIKILQELRENKLPYHKAFKKANYINQNGELIIGKEPNAYKFETFIFDAFASVEKMSILRTKREEEFAPVKNKEGNDSPETARDLYNNYMKNK